MSTARHRRDERRGRRLVATVVGVLAALAAIVAVQFPDAYGAYFAKITNSNDAVTTNPYFTCAAAQAGTANGAYFTYALNDAGSILNGVLSATAADSSGNNRTGTYSTTGVTLNQTNSGSGAVCPRDGKTVATFDGVSGAAYASTATTAAIAAPAQFSLEIWFKTSTPQGKLIGFGNARTGSSSQYDRHLYIDTNGKLVFGVYPNAVKVIRTTASVTDGQWHHAVATLSSTAGMALYLDGRSVATDATTKTAETNNSGYWRLGYDNLNSWDAQGSNYYFKGQLAYASVYTSVLSATTVAQHFAAGD